MAVVAVAIGNATVDATAEGEEPGAPYRTPLDPEQVAFAFSFAILPVLAAAAITFGMVWPANVALVIQTGYVLLGGLGIGGFFLIYTLPVMAVVAILVNRRRPGPAGHMPEP